jgi:3-deoxy-D-manno-octulosonate 8-phosphate phosphatase (KDO 8-P phosphatase)
MKPRRLPPSTGKAAAGKLPASKPAAPSMGRSEVKETRPSAPIPKEEILELVRGPLPGPVKILFLDVDGTLTDGIIGFDQTSDSRNFFIRDGLAIEWARDLDVLPIAISGRGSLAVEARMRDLKMEHHLSIKDKVAVAEQILRRESVTWDQCVMVGDDLPDVALMRRVGWPIAVADAVPEVKALARTVTGHRGGHGAIREVVEMVLRHNGTWEKVLIRYEANP